MEDATYRSVDVMSSSRGPLLFGGEGHGRGMGFDNNSSSMGQTYDRFNVNPALMPSHMSMQKKAPPATELRTATQSSTTLGGDTMDTSEDTSKPPAVAASVTTTSETVLAPIAPPESWTNPQMIPASIYHCADMHSLEFPLSQWEAVTERVPRVLRAMSIQANYINEPMSATLQTMDNVEFRLCFWKCRPNSNDHGEPKFMVEVQRRRGDELSCSTYGRRILQAIQPNAPFDENDLKNDDYYTSLDIHQLRKAEDVLRDAMQSARLPKEVFPSPEQQAANSLEMVKMHLSSPRLDARRLGLESLSLMTDPRRTTLSASEAAAKAVLLGKAEEGVIASASPQFEESCKFIQRMVLRLVQKRAYGDENLPSESTTPPMFQTQEWFPSDDEEFGKKIAPEYAEYMGHLFHLALQCLVNSIEVLVCCNSSETAAPMIEQFLKDCTKESGDDMLRTLVDCVTRATRKQHNAYLATKALADLAKSSDNVKRRLSNLN